MPHHLQASYLCPHFFLICIDRTRGRRRQKCEQMRKELAPSRDRLKAHFTNGDSWSDKTTMHAECHMANGAASNIIQEDALSPSRLGSISITELLAFCICKSFCWKGYLFIRAWPRPTDRDPCFHCRNRFRNSTEDGIRPLFRWRHSRRRLHLCIERERGLHTQDASCTADLVNVAYESLRRHRRRHLGAFSVSLSDFLVAVDPTLIPSSASVN